MYGHLSEPQIGENYSETGAIKPIPGFIDRETETWRADVVGPPTFLLVRGNVGVKIASPDCWARTLSLTTGLSFLSQRIPASSKMDYPMLKEEFNCFLFDFLID